MNDWNLAQEITVSIFKVAQPSNQWELGLELGGEIVSDKQHLAVIYVTAKRHKSESEYLAFTHHQPKPSESFLVRVLT